MYGGRDSKTGVDDHDSIDLFILRLASGCWKTEEDVDAALCEHFLHEPLIPSSGKSLWPSTELR